MSKQLPQPSMTEQKDDSHQSHHDTFFQGVMFMMLGLVLFSIADTFGKLVTASFPLSLVIWLRSVFGMILIAIVILFRGKPSDFKTTRIKATCSGR